MDSNPENPKLEPWAPIPSQAVQAGPQDIITTCGSVTNSGSRCLVATDSRRSKAKTSARTAGVEGLGFKV